MSAPCDYALMLIRKAEGDRHVLRALADDPDTPRWILGFHAQQAVEKAFKSVLTNAGVSYPFTHDILFLIEMLRSNALDAPPNAEDLLVLTGFGAAWRYDDPVDEPVSIEPGWMLQRVDEIMTWAKTMLRGKKEV